MAWRNVFIASPAKISVKNTQLVVETNCVNTIPIEDISACIIESVHSTITASAIQMLSAAGVCIFFCDEKHMPSSVLTPYNSHSRKLKILKAQLELKPVLQKSLWKDIVIQKIKNQAQVLSLCGKNNSQLISLVPKVKSDDNNNMEAVAASKYFKLLFGSGFSRGQDTLENARLNYGYALLRGIVARNLVVYGFETSIGIHHKSQLNAFNLADDLMEVYRPAVDLCVFQMEENDTDTLSTQDKQILFNLLNCDVSSGKQNHTIAYAIERTVQSYQKSLLENNASLTLCEMLPIQLHQYE